MGRTRFLTILIGLLFSSAVGMAQVTVVGTDTYPADVNNVQAAVLVPYATVYLLGVFNFGETGQVVLSAPGVTLQGLDEGATIKGGYYPLTTIPVPDATAPATAKNLTIRNLRFQGWSGFAIYHMGVQDKDNVTRIEGNTLINTRWPAAADSFGIHYCTGGGKAEIRNNTLVDISMLSISTHALDLHPDDHLLIEGNVIENAHYDPVVVDVWEPSEGDNESGPVIIRNNRIAVSPDVLDPYIWVIDLGFWYGSYVNNAVIEGNILSGYVCDGICGSSYVRNRKIIGNDLSGLTAFEAQIGLMGRDDLVVGNVLGPVDTSPGFAMGAIYIFAVNWLAGDFPDAEPLTGNILEGNDFRLTGLKGWALDESGGFASIGSVILATSVDMGWDDWWPGCEVTGNLVKETGRFPAGTGGAKQQVLEFPIYAHHNRIVGHAANEYAQLGASNPGIGSKIREAGAKLMERMAEKRACIKKWMPEKGGR